MRFNNTGYAEFYHRHMEEAGYPGKLLPFVMEEVAGSRSVIDVGSGTGFFALPIAESGYNVSAVEPSAGMMDILKRRIPSDLISSITFFEMPWENWKGAMHDALISVHSLYPMPDIEMAVRLMHESAGKKIIIIRDSTGMKTLSGIVRERLGMRESADLNGDLKDIISGLVSDVVVRNIYETRRFEISDISRETESLLYQLRLGREYFSRVSGIIEEELRVLDDRSFFEAIYSDNAYIF